MIRVLFLETPVEHDLICWGHGCSMILSRLLLCCVLTVWFLCHLSCYSSDLYWFYKFSLLLTKFHEQKHVNKQIPLNCCWTCRSFILEWSLILHKISLKKFSSTESTLFTAPSCSNVDSKIICQFGLDFPLKNVYSENIFYSMGYFKTYLGSGRTPR